MKKKCPEGDFGVFTARLEGEILHICFRKNLMEHLANLSKRDMICNFVNQIKESGDVKVILLNSDFRDTGCEAYTYFILKKSQAGEKIDFHRLFNITSQVVMGIIGLDMVVIHACQGNVISLLLNISLACDYRIAADNTVFCNPYIDLGLVPIGGGPYFLSKLTGTGKAWEALLLNKDIDASKALELGLVDRVVASANFDQSALDIAHMFADNHAKTTIAGLKKLINFSKKDLETYFEIEKQEILKIIQSNDFSKRCGKNQKGCSWCRIFQK